MRVFWINAAQVLQAFKFGLKKSATFHNFLAVAASTSLICYGGLKLQGDLRLLPLEQKIGHALSEDFSNLTTVDCPIFSGTPLNHFLVTTGTGIPTEYPLAPFGQTRIGIDDYDAKPASRVFASKMLNKLGVSVYVDHALTVNEGGESSPINFSRFHEVPPVSIIPGQLLPSKENVNG